MGYQPAVVWRMTVVEYDAAVRGYLQRNGVDPAAPPAMTRSRLEELKRLYPDT